MGIGGFRGNVRNYLTGAGRNIGGLRINKQPAPMAAPQPQFGSGGAPIMRFPSYMPKGASMTPAGDIGERRQRESVSVGGFKDGETVRASSVFTSFKGGK